MVTDTWAGARMRARCLRTAPQRPRPGGRPSRRQKPKPRKSRVGAPRRSPRRPQPVEAPTALPSPSRRPPTAKAPHFLPAAPEWRGGGGGPRPAPPPPPPPRRSGAAVRPQPPGRTPHDPASGCRRRAAPPPKVEHPGLRVPRRGRVPRRARRSWCRAVHSDSLLDGLCRRLGDLPAHGRALSPQRSAPGLPGRPAPWQQQHTKDLLNDFGCC